VARLSEGGGQIQLDRLSRLPAALLDITPREITQVLPNPALVSLAGKGDPLFLSVLLHGNETAGFDVLQELTRRYADAEPPRGLIVFIGNVRATGAAVRFLPEQPDFNRIWRGGEGPYRDLAGQVTEAARRAGVFASIDVHNNTGANPHYGCVASLRPADLHLAAMFAPIGVHYHIPNTTQSAAFSEFCPAVTVECGKSGDRAGVARALSLIEETMRLDGFPAHPPAPGTLKLYETVGRVVIDPRASISFGEAHADLVLRADLEDLNFTEVPAGTPWATGSRARHALRVVNEHDDDLTDAFFGFTGDTAFLKRAVTPAMVSRDETAVRLDCLCYLMLAR
jgi:hypothetical protein